MDADGLQTHGHSGLRNTAEFHRDCASLSPARLFRTMMTRRLGESRRQQEVGAINAAFSLPKPPTFFYTASLRTEQQNSLFLVRAGSEIPRRSCVRLWNSARIPWHLLTVNQMPLSFNSQGISQPRFPAPCVISPQLFLAHCK